MRSAVVALCSLLLISAAGAPAKTKVAAKRARKPVIHWDLANIPNPRVDYWIKRFQTDKRPKFMEFLRRKAKYEKMILAKLRARAMPGDLIYLAMIESGFNPHALSVAGARGMWQLIPDTARRYGLRVNATIDERSDPEKSTNAALAYLQDLQERFDCWYLAAAAYNTGENRVGRIMRAAIGTESGDDKKYYAIWDRLPDETRDDIPVMIAAARISKEPAKYGFDQPLATPPVDTEDSRQVLADEIPKVSRAELQDEHEALCSDANCPLKHARSAAKTAAPGLVRSPR